MSDDDAETKRKARIAELTARLLAIHAEFVKRPQGHVANKLNEERARIDEELAHLEKDESLFE